MIDYQRVCKEPYEFDEKEVFTALMDMDNMYNNDEEVLVSDKQYDALYHYTKLAYPNNTYFLGIGSSVRGEKVKLPIPMTGLNQVQIGDIDNWISKNNLTDLDAIISDKLDGISAMIVYDMSGNLQIAYSRGDGLEGADITRHIRNFPSIPKKINHPSLIVRGEVIIPKDEFEIARNYCPRDSGELYKNARNMVAGIMNSKEVSNPKVYEHIHFVAYGIPGDNQDKQEQLNLLINNNFKVVFNFIWSFYDATDENLSIQLCTRRAQSNYELDGLVIEVDKSEIREELSSKKSSLEPQYAKKFKIADVANEAIAIVTSISWKISKHGYLKPTVIMEPVELVGVTIQRASGYNAKFIIDNCIGPGAKIRITRAGDVIPDILEVIEQSPYGTFMSMPDIPWNWNETNVDIVAQDLTDEEYLLKLKSFFNSIGVKNLQEASIQKLIDYGKDDITNIIRADLMTWEQLMGVNGKKAYISLHQKLSNIYPWELMGAFPYFYRGFGQTRAKLITDMYPDYSKLTIEDVTNIPGFDTKTAEKFISNLPNYLKFEQDLISDGLINFKANEPVIEIIQSKLTSKKFVFTGFRDKEAEEFILRHGGILQDGIKKDTDILIAKDASKNSSKLTKAREQGVEVIGIDEFNSYWKNL